MAELLARYSRHDVAAMRMKRVREATAGGEIRTVDRSLWQPHAITRRLSAAQLATMRAEYERGEDSPVLAQRYGISENGVLAHLQRCGVPRRHGKVSAEDIVEMARLREAGWTYRQIGEKYGLTRRSVSRRLGSRHSTAALPHNRRPDHPKRQPRAEIL